MFGIVHNKTLTMISDRQISADLQQTTDMKVGIYKMENLRRKNIIYKTTHRTITFNNIFPQTHLEFNSVLKHNRATF